MSRVNEKCHNFLLCFFFICIFFSPLSLLSFICKNFLIWLGFFISRPPQRIHCKLFFGGKPLSVAIFWESLIREKHEVHVFRINPPFFFWVRLLAALLFLFDPPTFVFDVLLEGKGIRGFGVASSLEGKK